MLKKSSEFMDFESWITSSREELILEIKNNQIFQKLNTKLNFSDQEIWNYFINIKEYIEGKTSKINKNKIWFLEISRNPRTNQLEFEYVLNKNDIANEFLLENNFELASISRPSEKEAFEDIKIEEAKHFELFEYRETWKKATNTRKKVKLDFNLGLIVEGELNSLRNKVLSSIAISFALKKYKVAYIDVNYLEDSLKATFNNTDNEMSQIIKRMSDVDVLLLTEIGFRTYNSWFIESVLIKVLENRLKNKKLTYIGSYYSLKDLDSIANTKDSRISKFAMRKLKEIINSLCNYKIWIGF
ncbi:hypothetical protein [Mycoplasmopsis gallopavonis]|uniref:Uncharacterized protein n=1 Tax=Mycoplasmopsis gallopavonis TaxID=76629 RepID=A0A449AZ23_9BACT|nr:hypothetical protein [Mycoplasmopsis gallopavonis]RIV16964.1 hypothetical protein D1113_00260 [Mycoplasmopsis gallopavonis]VEU72788.1 Uncharacterised protein [Mycoplasmopsis gallopavonis]